MIALNETPATIIKTTAKEIHAFQILDGNIDKVTVQSFGEEWLKFNKFSEAEIKKIGNDYFDILPSELRNKNVNALDVGCGSGRWAYYLAPIVGFIECVDPSNAVFAAANVLKDCLNTRIIKTDVDNLPFPDDSFDLVYSLGVLHHIPDTFDAMNKCVRKVKPGGYFLVYLYYNFENRGFAFKSIFQLSNFIRKRISKMAPKIKTTICSLIAFTVYLPLARTSKVLEKVGAKKLSKKIPLSYYRDKSIYILKNDALDRFGTPLEQRFHKDEIKAMMDRCGLKDISFSENEPYWHAIGKKI